MDKKFVSLFLVAVSLPVVLAGGSANACDEPGTPTNVTATVVWNFPPTITTSWINTANNDETVFWDVEMSDGGTTIFPQPAGIGHGDTGRGLQVFFTWTVDAPVGTRVTRCFKVKARTGPGTQGCDSKIFSNQACATMTASPTVDFPRALYAINIDEPLDASNTAVDVPLTFRGCRFTINRCPVTPEVEQWTYDLTSKHLLHAQGGECVSIGAEGGPGSPVILSPCRDFNPGSSSPRSDAWSIHAVLEGSPVWIIQNDLTQMCLHAVPGVFNPGGNIVHLSPAKLVQQNCDGSDAQKFGPADAEWVRQHAN